MNGIAMFTLGLFAGLGGCAVFRKLVGFSAQKPKDYANSPRNFDIRRHLVGPMNCDGVIYGPLGRVTSRFTADFDAKWSHDTCRMTERFRYDSGTVQDREWRLSVDSKGEIQAEAADLVGKARGRQFGSGVMLVYRIRLPESAGSHVLDVVDWMYLLDNGVIVNRSQFRKFGIKVAELVATIRPAASQARREEAA